MRQSRLLAALALTASLISLGFVPRGVGGGGATASYSISPYAELRFVGSDMGTFFRSTDGGRHWEGIDHREEHFSSDLPNAGDAPTSTAGLRVKDNLRGKRRDPWPWSTHRQKRWPPNAKW